MSEANNSLEYFQAQYQRFVRLGFIICGTFFSAILLASTLINISGAVTASGKVVQVGENKSVQHPTGGPVGKILVQNGDSITQGQPILILDSVAIESKHKALTQRQFELTVTLDRLMAISDDEAQFIVDPIKHEAAIQQHPDIVTTQEALFVAQKNSLATAAKQLKVRMKGLTAEKKALTSQLTTNKQQLNFLNESIIELEDLYKRQLISKSRLITLQRDRVSVLTQIESLYVTQVQLENNYNEAKQSLESLYKENKETVWQKIETAKTELHEVQGNLDSTADQLTRLIINAPASGRVHELSIKNINAVIQAGEVILKIVPIAERLIIHSRVTPMDIEQLYIGQEARIRLDTFDTQTTPEIKGKVTVISADSTLDRDTNETYFLVKVSLEEEEIKKVTTGDITTGLPVTTLFTTNERTLMGYLLKPLKNQLFSAFREG